MRRSPHAAPRRRDPTPPQSPRGLTRRRAGAALMSASLLSASLLSACARETAPTEVPVPAPAFKEASTPASGPSVRAGEPWWERFGDAGLTSLVGGLMLENLALAQARERVIQMRAVATQTGSQRWPQLSLDVGWARNKQLNQFALLNRSGSSSAAASGAMGGATGGAATPTAPTSTMPTSFTLDTYRASLAVSYEVDLWGRVGSLTEAAERDAVAAEQDLRGMAVTLSASAVDLWLQLVEMGGRARLLRAQIEDAEELLQLTAARFEEGLAPHLQVLQQAQQRDNLRAQLPLLEAQTSSMTRRLAALLGRSGVSLSLPESLPSLPPLPALGLPGELLLARPDVKAAQARLAAADARVSAAVSARYPSLRLGGSVGLQAFEVEKLFDDFVWGLSAGLLTPLFDAGRLASAQEQQESVLRERGLALKERLITAYHEVEDALALEREQRAQLAVIDEVLEGAEALVDSSMERYLEGLGDFLSVLSARQGLYAAQLSRLSAARACLSSRVQLHRALAGDIEPPTPKTPSQEPSL